MTAVPRWDAALYADNSAHHRRHDDDVLRGLELPAGLIVDVGCGVGDFAARLAELAPAARVVGVDADADMVAAARTRNGARAEFQVCRAERLDARIAPGSVRLLVSRAALHWIPAASHPAMLASFARVLGPGGRLRAEFGGSGQIAAVRAVLDEESVRLGGTASRWYFPTEQEYSALLAGAGFRTDRADGADGADGADCWVRLLHQRRSFPGPDDITGYLRSQIFLHYEETLPAAAVPEFRDRAERRAVAELRRADGTYDLDFVRLDLSARV